MKLENGMVLPAGTVFIVHSVGFFCGPKFYKDVYVVGEDGSVEIFGKKKKAEVEECAKEVFFTIEDDGMTISACVFRIADKEVLSRRIESLEEQVVKGCKYNVFEKSELEDQLKEHKKALKSLNIPTQLKFDKFC